jgi:hypothetical protein
MLPRWTTGEVTEITDEMRLVGVAALGGRADAALASVHPVEHRQRELEARDARQPLRRDADDLLEATFEMTASHACPKGERIDRRLAASAGDCLDDVTHADVQPDGVKPLREPLDHEIDRSCRRIGFAAYFRNARVKRWHQILHRQRQPGEIALWCAQQARCAVGMEADADHRDAPGRAQHELPRELAGEQYVRLTFGDAVRVDALERIAEMQYQFGSAVWKYWLQLGPELSGITFERPHTLDGRPQCGGGGELAVFQGPPTLSRNMIENSA